MSIIFHIYHFLICLPYLLGTPISTKRKFSIVVNYVKLFIVVLLLAKIKKYHTVKFLKLKMTITNYSAFLFLYEEIFLKNLYYFNAVNTSPIIFDCGSNLGLSVLYFKYLYPKSKIYSYEPDPKTFSILEKNIQLNILENVTTHNVALSSKEGHIDFYTTKGEESSLTMSTYKSYERKSDSRIRVKTDRLSNYINQNIDFLKMDIEGSEREVIRDLDKNGKLFFIKEMIVEYHHNLNTQYQVLADFISIFEKNDFLFQADCRCIPMNSKHKFQDIMFYFYK